MYSLRPSTTYCIAANDGFQESQYQELEDLDNFRTLVASDAFWTLLCLLPPTKVIMNHGENWWCLIVKFSRILGTFRCFSEHFTGFPHAGCHASHSSRVKNLMAPRERARQKVLYADARFCQVAGFPVRWRL